jgi:hypothetical protein
MAKKKKTPKFAVVPLEVAVCATVCVVEGEVSGTVHLDVNSMEVDENCKCAGFKKPSKVALGIVKKALEKGELDRVKVSMNC